MDNITDIPDSYPLLDLRQDNSKTLMTVLAIMAFLASLALIFALSAKRLNADWQNELGQSATIQILLDEPELRDIKIEAAITVLQKEYPDAVIEPLGHQQSQDLLRPWLGSVELPENLPVPALVTIDFDGPKRLDLDALKVKLSAEGLLTQIDDHSRWSAQIGRTGRGLWTSAIAILSLIFLACAAVAAYATQAALSAQRDIIRVLLQVGASDRFIAKLFIWQASKRGLISGFLGVLCGFILAVFLRLRRNPDTALFPDMTLSFTDIFWLILLPLFIGFICALAAGLTSFRLLGEEHRRA